MVNPFGNISKLMKQAKEMQNKIKKAQEVLASMQIEGISGAGLVKLNINGKGEAINLLIDDSILNEDKKVLQGLIIAAINDANIKRETKKKETMGDFTSSLEMIDSLNINGDTR